MDDGDGRIKLAPAAAIRLVITNLVLGREAALRAGRVGRPLSTRRCWGWPEATSRAQRRPGRPGAGRLFDADRASLLTALMLGVITEFGIDTAELHNDSTSISVHGVYRDATAPRAAASPPR